MKAAQLGAVGSATRGAAAGVRQQQHVAAPRRPARGRALRPLAASERDGPQVQEPAEADRAGQKEEAPGFGFNSVSGLNPLVLGRRSRAFVDSVWQRVLDLGNVGRSSVAYEDLEVLGLTSGDFEAPEASYTTVSSRDDRTRTHARFRVTMAPQTSSYMSMQERKGAAAEQPPRHGTLVRRFSSLEPPDALAASSSASCFSVATPSARLFAPLTASTGALSFPP